MKPLRHGSLVLGFLGTQFACARSHRLARFISSGGAALQFRTVPERLHKETAPARIARVLAILQANHDLVRRTRLPSPHDPGHPACNLRSDRICDVQRRSQSRREPRTGTRLREEAMVCTTGPAPGCEE